MNTNQRETTDSIASGVLHPLRAANEAAFAEFTMDVKIAYPAQLQGVGFECFFANGEVRNKSGFVSTLEVSPGELPPERCFSAWSPVGFGCSLSSKNFFLCDDFGEPHQPVVGGDFGIADVQNVQAYPTVYEFKSGVVEVSRIVPSSMEAGHDNSRNFHGEEFGNWLSEPELVMPGVTLISLESSPFNIEFVAEVKASDLLLLECGHSGNPEDASVTEIQV